MLLPALLPFELVLSIICFRELWVACSEEEVFSTLISGASRAITLSAIQVTHVVFTMQSRELYNQLRDTVKFLKLGVPKIDPWICPVHIRLELSIIFA